MAAAGGAPSTYCVGHLRVTECDTGARDRPPDALLVALPDVCQDHTHCYAPLFRAWRRARPRTLARLRVLQLDPPGAADDETGAVDGGRSDGSDESGADAGASDASSDERDAAATTTPATPVRSAAAGTRAPAASLTLDALAHDTARVLDTHPLTQRVQSAPPVFCLGTGAGAALALRFAVLYPARCAGCILVSPPQCHAPPSQWERWWYLAGARALRRGYGHVRETSTGSAYRRRGSAVDDDADNGSEGGDKTVWDGGGAEPSSDGHRASTPWRAPRLNERARAFSLRTLVRAAYAARLCLVEARTVVVVDGGDCCPPCTTKRQQRQWRRGAGRVGRRAR